MTNVIRYRKKPVVVEAFCTTWPLCYWPEWEGVREEGNKIFCDTLEGPLEVKWGDWIIKGIKGEVYPCKPDIFEATYEAVSESNEL